METTKTIEKTITQTFCDTEGCGKQVSIFPCKCWKCGKDVCFDCIQKDPNWRDFWFVCPECSKTHTIN